MQRIAIRTFIARQLALVMLLVVSVSASYAAAEPLDTEMEDVKKALLELKRDLIILEEDLLFPASSQLAVFLSMDLGEFFQLDAVTVKLNGKEVAHHLYTDKQVDALYRGGVQKLFIGNIRQGDNRITAFSLAVVPMVVTFGARPRLRLRNRSNPPSLSLRSPTRQQNISLNLPLRFGTEAVEVLSEASRPRR